MSEIRLLEEATNQYGRVNYLKQNAESGVSRSQRNTCLSSEWFAMSATYGRSLKAKEFLESKEVRCFIPMKYVMVNDRTRGKVRKLAPAINNLLFVYTTKSNIQELKKAIGYLHYMVKAEDGRNVPIIVPEDQMSHFMNVCQTHDESLRYMSPDEVNLEKGTPVRIVGGQFDGVEATFVRVNKARKKSIVVLVKGVAAVMLTELTGCYIQTIE